MPRAPQIFRPPVFGQRLKKPETRESAHQRGYDIRWQRYRRYFLAMLAVDDADATYNWQKGRNGTCEQCGAYENLELDHIVALAKGGMKYDPYNIQVLCKTCHSQKTAKEDGSFGRDTNG